MSAFALLFGVSTVCGAPTMLEDSATLLVQPDVNTMSTTHTNRSQHVAQKREDTPSFPYDDLEEAAKDYSPDVWPDDSEPASMTAEVDNPRGSTSVLYLGDSDIEKWPLDLVQGKQNKDGSVGCTCGDVIKRWKPSNNTWVALICGENAMLRDYLFEHPEMRSYTAPARRGKLLQRASQAASQASSDALDAERPTTVRASSLNRAFATANSSVIRIQDTAIDKAFQTFKTLTDLIVKSGSRILYLGTKPEPAMPPGLKDYYFEYDKRIIEYAMLLAGASDAQAKHAYSTSSSSLSTQVRNQAKPTTLYSTVLSNSPPLVVVDVHGAFLDLGNPRDLYYIDGMHLSDKGYRYLTQWSNTAFKDYPSTCVVWKNDICKVRV